MYNHEKQHLKSGFDALAPDLLESICNQEVEFIESEELLLGRKEETKHRHRIYIAGISSLAAFAIICLIFLLHFNQTIFQEKQIIFDINPSICITLNKNNQVKKVDALNEDGKQIISDIHTDVSLEQTINEILQRLDEYHYLRNNDSEMLITYVCKNGEEPQLSVESAINEYINLANCPLTIIYQTLEPKSKLTNSAKKQGISIGKYYFLQRLENEYGMDTHNLYKENIHEIVNHMKEQGIDISNIESTPTVSSTQITSEKKTTQKTTEKVTEQSIEITTEKVTEQSIEITTEKVTEQSIEETTKKPKEKVTEQSIENISPNPSETTQAQLTHDIPEETTIPLTDIPIDESISTESTTTYTETSVTSISTDITTTDISTTDSTELSTNNTTTILVETTTIQSSSEYETSDSTIIKNNNIKDQCDYKEKESKKEFLPTQKESGIKKATDEP